MSLTCADEQDVVGAVHCLHSVHHQLTELVVDADPHQQGPLSQRQHVFLRHIHNCAISKCEPHINNYADLLPLNQIDRHRLSILDLPS